MRQDDFEKRYAADWATLEHWLLRTTKRDTGDSDIEAERHRLPALYRRVCHHLALARRRGYSPALQDRLNSLALGGHRHLYTSRPRLLPGIGRFVAHTFPAAFRREGRFMLLSALLFGLPLLAMIVSIQLVPSLVYAVIDPSDVAMMESMYDPDNRVLGRERGSDSDFAMFGFYVYNNVSIALRMFGGGILAGVGTVLVLLFNGLYIGSIAGHLTHVGYTDTFWPFVVGHGSFELTALVIAGAAGLKLGYVVWAPGRRRRVDALVHTARECLPLIYGAGAMLVLAAVVEAFWLSTTWLPPLSNYLAGASMWLLVGLYLSFAGRSHGR